MFSQSIVSSLSSFDSDHCPLLFQSSLSSLQVSPPFKFDPEWTNCPDFLTLLAKWWDEFPINPILEFGAQWKNKMLFLKRKIKGWAKNYYGTKKKQEREALATLLQLEQIKESRPLTMTEFELWQTTKAHLDKIYLEEEEYWKLRSKNQWLQEGDQNIKLFHRVAAHRRKHNRIHRLVSDSRELTSVLDI